MIVLIIGYGSIAKKHKAALDSLYPDARVFALRSGTKAGSAEIEGVQSIFDPGRFPQIRILQLFLLLLSGIPKVYGCLQSGIYPCL